MWVAVQEGKGVCHKRGRVCMDREGRQSHVGAVQEGKGV